MTDASITAEPPPRAAPPGPASGEGPSRYRTGALFLLPALVLLGVWLVYPTVYTIVRSFFGPDGYLGGWVGIDNYRRLFTTSTLVTAIKNSAIWVAVVPAFVTALTHVRSDEPGLKRGTKIPRQAQMKAVADAMARAAGYVSEVAYQLYDVTGATEDWNYFSQNAFAYTTEVGYDDFHVDYQDAVVDRALTGSGGTDAWITVLAAAGSSHSLLA